MNISNKFNYYKGIYALQITYPERASEKKTRKRYPERHLLHDLKLNSMETNVRYYVTNNW